MNLNNLLSGEEVVFTTAPSRDQLQAYFHLRSLCYREVIGLHLAEGEDEDDRHAEFVLALSAGRVIGGIRLVFCERGSHHLLPLENENFVLERLYPDLQLPQKTYFEAGRLAIDRPFRRPDVATGLYARMIALGQRRGSSYMFAVAPCGAPVRYHRKIFAMIGVNYEIQPIVAPPKPPYENIAPCLTLVRFAGLPDFQPWLADHLGRRRYYSRHCTTT